MHVSQAVRVSASGVLESKTLSKGTLTVRSFNPLTGALGEPIPAKVEEEYEAEIETNKHLTTSKGKQRLEGTTTQEFSMRLKVGSGGKTDFFADQVCGL